MNKNGTLAKEITKNLKFWYPDIKMLNDFGIFAEGAVLGKGALRNLILDKNIAKNLMLHTINANFMIKEATNGLVLVKLSLNHYLHQTVIVKMLICLKKASE